MKWKEAGTHHPCSRHTHTHTAHLLFSNQLNHTAHPSRFCWAAAPACVLQLPQLLLRLLRSVVVALGGGALLLVVVVIVQVRIRRCRQQMVKGHVGCICPKFCTFCTAPFASKCITACQECAWGSLAAAWPLSLSPCALLPLSIAAGPWRRHPPLPATGSSMRLGQVRLPQVPLLVKGAGAGTGLLCALQRVAWLCAWLRVSVCVAQGTRAGRRGGQGSGRRERGGRGAARRRHSGAAAAGVWFPAGAAAAGAGGALDGQCDLLAERGRHARHNAGHGIAVVLRQDRHKLGMRARMDACVCACVYVFEDGA